MRAVVGEDFSGIDGLALREMEPAALGPGMVRIAVRAAGVSFANLLVVQGKHQNRPVPPYVPGTEVAGVVTEVANDLPHGLAVGDRVCAGLASGGFAGEAVASADTVFRIPDGMDFATATQFPTIYATAYAALKWRAMLAPGEVLLVHGAAGASGLAAVEIGRALGARVVATAGGSLKLEAARAHGAHEAIDYRVEDVRQRVLDLTDGRGADVVFDPVGGDVFDQSLRCAAPLARLLPIGFAGGRIPQIPANIVLVKNLTIIGLYWGFYMGWGKTPADSALREKVRRLFAELFRMHETGALRCPIDRCLPLASFAEALRLVEARSVIGKIVLVPDQ